MVSAADGWLNATSILHLAGACATAGVAAVLARRHLAMSRAGRGVVGMATIASLAATALWCFTVAAAGGLSLPAEMAMALRNLAWLFLLFRLFAHDGRDTSVAAIRPVVMVLGLVALLRPMVVLIETHLGGALAHSRLAFHFSTMLAMLEAVGSLVLVHNLYTSAAKPARRALRWPALGLALQWGFELNLFTVAWLGNAWPAPLAAVHGLVDVGFAVLLALGALEHQEALRLRPSRVATFRLVSLLIIGAYFVAMVAVAQWLADAGGDYARWLQFGFLIIAVAAALLMLPSRRLRGWLRVTLVKHLFQHRYDYRAEWLRFNRTMSEKGGAGDDSPSLHARAVQALADITDSPAGLLLMPDEHGELVLATRWQWLIDVPAPALSRELARFIEAHDYIVNLAGEDRDTARGDITPPPPPEWLAADPRAWALVPLLHYERLVGAVVLARPAHLRQLDWEDFDLLRVAGQQLASYLAEHAGQEALAEAARFEDFNRRMAFVMHDIKNLVSQFSLLARNAERHADNPEFRADMLVTLRSSADKLGALVNRLSRYGGAVERSEAVPLGPVALEVARGFEGRHSVRVILRHDCTVTGERHAVEQALTHLVQNAVDASTPEAPVFIDIGRSGEFARIEVVDAGAGMSPEFVRHRLFKPFDSSKPGGFGVGACEARDLIRAMGGRLDVESREGLGTRFIIRLPLAEVDSAPDTASQKALPA